MKKTWILIILLSALLILTSCGGGGGGGGGDDDDNIGDLAALDISGAKSVFISSNSSTLYSQSLGFGQKSSSNQGGNSLWKILENNSIQKVNMLDKNKKKMSMRQYGNELVPILISTVNNNFFVVCFMDSTRGNSIYADFACLVRKTDGAIFKLKSLPYVVNNENDIFNKNLFKTDGLGNMYYLSHDDFYSNRRYVVKVNLSTFSSTSITPSTQDVERFEVDDVGNMIYSGTSANIFDHISRIRSAAGVYDVLPIEYLGLVWHGLDGALYYISELNVKRINPSTLASEAYGVLASAPSWYGVNSTYYNFNFNNCTYVFGASGLTELYNSTATPRDIPYIGVSMSYITPQYCLTEDYLYIAGKDTSHNYILFKVDPDTGTCTQILGNEYEIYSFSASEQDGIIFNALRMADGKRIIGKVSTSGGAVTVLDQESNAQITYLERIR